MDFVKSVTESVKFGEGKIAML